MQTNDFVDTVTRLGGPDDAHQAADVVEVVLVNLGKRLKGGQARNLAAQLPDELEEPLVRHGDAEPVLDGADDFLRRVAEKLGPGADPETAVTSTRAVLAALVQAVSAGEVENLRSQLPAGFGPLFEQPGGAQM